MAYARVGAGGFVFVYPTLPKQWTFTKTADEVQGSDENGNQFTYVPYEEGATTGNFDSLPDFILKAEGFLPYLDNPPSFNPATQVIEIVKFDITEDSITPIYQVNDLPQEVVEATEAAKVQAAKAQAKGLIEAERTKTLQEGFVFQGKTYACDKEAKINMLICCQALSFGMPFPDNFGWKPVDSNDLTPMDEDTFKQMVIAAAGMCYNTYTKSFELKKNLEDAEDLAAVASISVDF